MNLIAVDPGRYSGIAAFYSGSLIAYARVQTDNSVAGIARHRALKLMNSELLRADEDGIYLPSEMMFVVEDQWHICPKKGQYKSAPFATTKVLIENRVRWQVAAEYFTSGVEVVTHKWINTATAGLHGKSTEKVTTLCKMTYPGIVVSDDEAAAIMLGRYWLRENGCSVIQNGEPTRLEKIR